MPKENTSKTIRLRTSTYDRLVSLSEDIEGLDSPDEAIRFLLDQYDQRCMEE